ncbi:MAG: phytanoyl-CoA dioxygenase family protein [Proteobacteria bacterium]|jgi:hypothetical protein|nr:phytanoyl-CoA dioxygenase family protein [Pseudomonadota bacterium]
MKLTSAQMAEFVAAGVLGFEGLVPDALNRRFIDEAEQVLTPKPASITEAYRLLLPSEVLPKVSPGVSFGAAFRDGHILKEIFSLPKVAGLIDSLVGPDARFDHHFLHLTLGQGIGDPRTVRAQHNHQDSTIDPRQAFDIQLFYFPQAVTFEMGGTRYIPGSHLRVVSEAAIARYQNLLGQRQIVCPAGSIYCFHMGVWHGAGANRSADQRLLYKIRLAPNGPQVRLWNDEDLSLESDASRPIFWSDNLRQDPVAERLMRLEPWYEADTGRLELINRIKLWRYLTGSPQADIDYWMTRIENEQA